MRFNSFKKWVLGAPDLKGACILLFSFPFTFLLSEEELFLRNGVIFVFGWRAL